MIVAKKVKTVSYYSLKKQRKSLFSGFMDRSKMMWISTAKIFRLAVRKKFVEIRTDKENKMCEDIILFQLLNVFTNRLDKCMYRFF